MEPTNTQSAYTKSAYTTMHSQPAYTTLYTKPAYTIL